MSDEKPINCARPTGGPVGEKTPEQPDQPQQSPHPSGGKKMVSIGRKAPDFSAPAFFNGAFTSVTLSDYLGKWVSLCFYPGDFTFV